MTTTVAPWWQGAVVYHVYPRSFADADGDGVGDLAGLLQRLPHISSLGVDAVWLSPVYPGPGLDHGYDVTSLTDVDPQMGTVADVDRLLGAAHADGVRVILDWIGNHTSDQHPWFLDAVSSRDAEKRDWYVWVDGDPDRPPNNWLAAFKGQSAWAWHEPTRQWYLHFYLEEQPDLNWANPDLRAAMLDTLRFWLDRGVDGFRLDVPHCMGKDRTWADNPAEVADIRRSKLNDCVETHGILRDIRRVVDEYDDRMTVGEVNLMTTDQLGPYHGTPEAPELHLSFNFPPPQSPWDAGEWRAHIARTEELYGRIGAWPTWHLSNHDYPRHRTRYGGSEAVARAAAVLLLTLRGTAFVYAGEELGLEDADVPPERRQDPGGWRDGCRAPIPWEADPPHGWEGKEPWMPWPPEAGVRNAESLATDPTSILHLYRRLIDLRRRSHALRLGDLALLDDVPAGVVAWERSGDDGVWRTVVNFTADAVAVADLADLDVELTSDGASPAGDTLLPHQAVLGRVRSR